MIGLLGFSCITTQWRAAKAAAKNKEAIDNSQYKQPKKSKQFKLKLAMDFIDAFANKLQNFRPVDSKNATDLEKSEVIIPFETTAEFYRYECL